MIDYRATQDLRDETTSRGFEQYEDAKASKPTPIPITSGSSRRDCWTCSPADRRSVRFEVAGASAMEL
jgi:hypothetical protein